MKAMRIITILCLVVISFSTCKNEGIDCHRTVTIYNNSNQRIIHAFKFTDPNKKCQLSGLVLDSGEYYEDVRRVCFESEISTTKPYDLYIVDPSNYNDPYIFYSCDSIEIKNTVLKHYILTLDDLKQSNFTISYP